MKNYDIIIPTYNPSDNFIDLLIRLDRQTIKPDNIIIINTDKNLWDRYEIDQKIQKNKLSHLIKVCHIAKDEFDHGRSRNLGISYSNNPYFVCMTQDAIPADDKTIEILIDGMDDKIAMSYARQLPRDDANEIEKYTREFNYPDKDMIKHLSDISRRGIKTYFASDVCAIYDRSIFDKEGHFEENIIQGEDTLYAAKVIEDGYKVLYNSKAKVIHSHNFTFREQYKRNYDIGILHANHPEIFLGLNTSSEGIKLVANTAKYLIKTGHILDLPRLFILSLAKYMGYKKGLKEGLKEGNHEQNQSDKM